MATCSVSKECWYLNSVSQELKFPHHVRVYANRTAALSMLLNLTQRQKARHFNVQHHWVRECNKIGTLLYYHRITTSGYVY